MKLVFNFFFKQDEILQLNYLTNIENEFSNDQTLDSCDLDELKKLRLFDKRFDEIIKEIGIFCIFLIFLFVVAFSNLSSSSFIYNQLFQSTFIDPQSSSEIGFDDVKKIFNSTFTYNLHFFNPLFRITIIYVPQCTFKNWTFGL
jgi:hypothetical protein